MEKPERECVHGLESVGCQVRVLLYILHGRDLELQGWCRDRRQCTSDRNGTTFWCQMSGGGSAEEVENGVA